jgi:hypothetical protein
VVSERSIDRPASHPSLPRLRRFHCGGFFLLPVAPATSPVLLLLRSDSHPHPPFSQIDHGQLRIRIHGELTSVRPIHLPLRRHLPSSSVRPLHLSLHRPLRAPFLLPNSHPNRPKLATVRSPSNPWRASPHILPLSSSPGATVSPILLLSHAIVLQELPSDLLHLHSTKAWRFLCCSLRLSILVAGPIPQLLQHALRLPLHHLLSSRTASSDSRAPPAISVHAVRHPDRSKS